LDKKLKGRPIQKAVSELANMIVKEAEAVSA
jgi:hypothetical protein